MAKKRGPSIHSRAARRATSPSIDTDKSLKDIKPPSRISAARPSVLAVHQSAGVQKKAKRGRKSQMSAKARRRHEKGLEMAEAVIERTSLKVEKSLGRERVVKERSKTWEDVNKKAGFAVLQDEGGQDEKQEDEGWETDEDMGGAGEKTLSAPAPVEAPVSATTVPLPIDEDEEIL
ncbi:Alb1-domain-containing protein [Thelonectria olida]|uniref:Alb1-domain-containing protein n=1 Tax=Thelonectria olida TaxID=1576542 RepID=A0A9P8W860_9HYPO|nr:Alb1-domain-containing protein [Thelonectria olida]